MKYLYKTAKFATSGWFSGGDIKIDELDRKLNEFGAEGWELISAVDTNTHQGATRYIVAIFKKPFE